MERSLLLTALVVLSAWVVVFFSIWHWGPGRVYRRVRCPDKHVPARLTVLYSETRFGAIGVSNVASCSLFPNAPVHCHKGCLTRL